MVLDDSAAKADLSTRPNRPPAGSDISPFCRATAISLSAISVILSIRADVVTDWDAIVAAGEQMIGGSDQEGCLKIVSAILRASRRDAGR
jgi:hypothetical protein